ncbi:hypothetical protein RGUI_1785 [Rhodovulum sp. P5]|uniref:DUF484 family protein n=1 Tax=Rhodovulum sp. P5 TaxID=1564506 RepID=UPI0009C1E901|nr:DUF484 family protein [Rhodovulum sp. P5]ARE39926.1 hypothetical protein RGUI_1785 [Rhodovulum sp. P5]
MSSTPAIADDLRAKIIAEPTVILDDPDLMRALVAANERKMGGNIVDMRGIAMERLETRLDRLEETHRSVIAAAYENIAGTGQIQRAVLRLLEPVDLPSFLTCLADEVAPILRVEALRIVLEAGEDAANARALGPVLELAPAGFCDAYIGPERPGRTVILRETTPGPGTLYDTAARAVRSEALIRMSVGRDGTAGLLALGSADPMQFAPNQGTDLLTFFGGVVERVLHRFVA